MWKSNEKYPLKLSKKFRCHSQLLNMNPSSLSHNISMPIIRIMNFHHHYELHESNHHTSIEIRIHTGNITSSTIFIAEYPKTMMMIMIESNRMFFLVVKKSINLKLRFPINFSTNMIIIFIKSARKIINFKKIKSWWI